MHQVERANMDIVGWRFMFSIDQLLSRPGKPVDDRRIVCMLSSAAPSACA